MSAAEKTQLIITIPTWFVTIGFIVLYSRRGERWYRSWFGISLMLIAWAVLAYTTSVILFRLFGPGYPGRDWLLVGSALLTLVAMLMRTAVLAAAQHDDRKHRSPFQSPR
jgi:hypothetical protein